MRWDSRYEQWDDVKVEDMIGRTFEKIIVNSEEIYFEDKDGIFTFYHSQDCCESVYIESIIGDVEDLLNTPLLKAEEAIQTGNDNYESSTWTFYKFATIKGYVDIRWVGESNGYYSESVDLKYKSKLESI